MKARLLLKSLLVAGLVVSGAASASANVEQGVEHLVVTPNAIQVQMLLAQRSIRQELLGQFDWRALALESLRNALAQPIVAERGAPSREYAAR